MKTLIETDEVKVAKKIEEVVDISKGKLPSEYFYSSLPLCVIDSVFSIGVKYESVRNTVKRYSSYFGINPLRESEEHPSIKVQISIDECVRSFEELGDEFYTTEIFKNKQRTSPTNGILKSQAVYQFCKVLQRYKVNYFQDLKKVIGNEEFEKDIRDIRGQKSGISLVYFYMLAGDKELIKPDRMIIRFLEECLQRKISLEEAQDLLEKTSAVLFENYKNINPRLLDYLIWNYYRSL